MKILYRPLSLGLPGLPQAKIPGNLFLAPMAGFTDLPFRQVCAEFGADLTYSEMVSAEGLYRESRKTLAILDRSPAEKQFAVQIFTSTTANIPASMKALGPAYPVLVDLNCGCPVPKIINNEAGSSLLKKPEKIKELVKSMVDNSNVPVTVKIRSGWDAASINFLETSDAALSAGAAAVTLHPRTRAQQYSGKSDWEHIRLLKAWAKEHYPQALIFGSGDLYTPEDARNMLEQTSCDAVMFARGSTGNPFLFSRTREFLTTGVLPPEPMPEERMYAAFHHLSLAMTQRKLEKTACKEMRKHLCNYTRGLTGSAEVRHRLVSCETFEQYRVIFADFFEHYEERKNSFPRENSVPKKL